MKVDTQIMTKKGITAYGCGPNEVLLFRKIADRNDVALTITEAALSVTNLELASGNQCISVDHKTHIPDSMLRALSRIGVAYISSRSTGCNHINVAYAKSVGITVGTVTYSSGSVADYTLMLMLMLVRNAKTTISRTAIRDYRLPEVRGRELRDLTIGVIGTGRIGVAVIERLQGFGCPVLAYDRYPKTSAVYAPLGTLLHQSDIITLHTPLNADTHHLLDRSRIAQMKRGALVINTGRGALLDTTSLIEALKDGRLSGAALDVLEGEEGIFYSDYQNDPIKNQQLLCLQELQNVIITPHTAYYTDHALSDMVENSIMCCLKFEKKQATWTN